MDLQGFRDFPERSQFGERAGRDTMVMAGRRRPADPAQTAPSADGGSLTLDSEAGSLTGWI
jgi:hypothetical protein